ncbi:uncharacterized protein LOC131076747 isoform X2 [Cryptomeria japonica]|uniref:uncharacterized protein LOC131076747 isoform X2 n=1 Tax=Cryptomeria japonica TaxID=3369 RepID=UPI0025AC52E6|nr:uncharacterized protein LOC131076747 isoform X2 [Cryptomeria japonica]
MAGLVARSTLFSSKPVIISSTNKFHLVRSHFAVAQTQAPRKLLLYSKKGCCLCDGLKEKLHSAFLMGGPDSLADVQLEVRDITTNPDWEKAYQYEIPVLVRLLADGSEEVCCFLKRF